jgi:hypothetical protein
MMQCSCTALAMALATALVLQLLWACILCGLPILPRPTLPNPSPWPLAPSLQHMTSRPSSSSCEQGTGGARKLPPWLCACLLRVLFCAVHRPSQHRFPQM